MGLGLSEQTVSDCELSQPLSTIAEAQSKLCLGPSGEILETIFSLARNNSNFLAGWIHGSRANQSEWANSDLDIALVVNDPLNITELRNNLASRLRLTPNFGDYLSLDRFDLWRYRNQEIGLHIMDYNSVSMQITNIFQSIDTIERYQQFAQHVILESHSIYDPHGLLAMWKISISTIPENLKVALIEKYLQLLSQKLMWWNVRPSWKGPFEQLADCALIVDELARCHYALNGRYHMVGLKEYPLDLLSLQPDIKSKIFDLVNLPNTNEDEPRKRHLIRGIVIELFQDYQRKFRFSRNATISKLIRSQIYSQKCLVSEYLNDRDYD